MDNSTKQYVFFLSECTFWPNNVKNIA